MENKPDLFPNCRQDSPRLEWMKKMRKRGFIVDEFDDDSFCATIQLSAVGTSKEDAMASLAVKLGIPLWNEEQYAKEHK